LIDGSIVGRTNASAGPLRQLNGPVPTSVDRQAVHFTKKHRNMPRFRAANPVSFVARSVRRSLGWRRLVTAG
jgi:hypothetical protein